MLTTSPQPMADLTERQINILKALIEAFIDEASPIGSAVLVGKCQLACSPATVRNEMAILSREGYIEKPHTSAGRIPTGLGFRFYISSLMDEQTIPVLQEVGVKQRLFQYRHSPGRLMREAVLALAETTGYLAVVAMDDEQLFHAGTVNLLEHPEFYDINVMKSSLDLLDHYDVLRELFSQTAELGKARVLVGKEIGLSGLEKVGLVFSRFGSERHGGAVAVLGPYRMDYAKVIPQVRHFSSILTEFSQSW